jgi:hypothetical protein
MWQRSFAILVNEAPVGLGGKAELMPCRSVPATPFVKNWRVSRVMPGAGKLEAVKCPSETADMGWVERTFLGDFADLHEDLAGSDKLVFLTMNFNCGESMRLGLAMGYDGPVKVWVDGRQVLHDPAGTNPAVQDRRRIPFEAAAGVHRMTIALGSNEGNAWGVFLRFDREDISLKPDAVDRLPACQ